MNFNELDLSEEILRAVEDLGFTEMTEIQEKSIPLLLEGRDVVGRSDTGTGKTAAFGIPAVESISPGEKNVTVLILCPTRELAMQAHGEIKKFAAYKRCIKASVIYGGASMEKQIHELKRGANIVIGTPGRIMDHIRRHTLKLDFLRCLILDEADEMLNMGFREDIEAILEFIPDERQTVLFSATMPPEILALTKKYQHDPVYIKLKAAEKSSALIDQYCFQAAMGRKTDMLRLLLTAYEPSSSMVFCNTRKMVDDLTGDLQKHGFKAVGLHGEMKQSQRTQVMESFKCGAADILVATDVAARGIDVTGVDAVFNYDIPQDNEYYIHRIGRTGRAGRRGTAYTLVSGRRQLYELRDIARRTNSDIKEIPLPDRESIIKKKKELIIKELSEEIIPMNEAYEILESLAALGIDSREAAARLIHKRLAAETADIPEFEKPQTLKKGRHRSSGTVKVDINIGRSRRISPNYILGALVDATGMSGGDFGKIDIFDDHTTVEVPESESGYIIERSNPMKIKGHQVEVRLRNGSSERKRQTYDHRRTPDRRKMAYGSRDKSEVCRNYISNRRKRNKNDKKY